MRLTANGANRLYYTHVLAGEGKKPCHRTDDGQIVISWREDKPFGLNGQYNFSLKLSKADLATIMMTAFGGVPTDNYIRQY